MHKPKVTYLDEESSSGKTRPTIKKFAKKLNKDENDEKT